MAGLRHPVTPDGRYFVFAGKLWRMSNPQLEPQHKAALVRELMEARRTVKDVNPLATSAPKPKRTTLSTRPKGPYAHWYANYGTRTKAVGEGKSARS